ncbi:hypothetical protein N9U57_02560 [Candidatus Pelagibacter sp.]|nr:hypothetical protein [Candidatus Pelagibacter sp.]
MSIFAAPSFYNQADQNIFTGGDRFITQERFRLGDPIQKNISFNPGIPSTTAANMLPTPLFVPRQGQDGGGGGISTTGFEEQSTTADDFGSGLKGDDPSMNMTQEEEDAINDFNNPQISTARGLTTAGLMSFGFLDPITAFASLAFARNKAKKEAMERAKEAAAKADFDRAMAQGQGFYDSLNEGRGASVSKESREQAGSGYDSVEQGSPFADGGRVPYMMGGLTNLVDIYD